MNNLNIEILVFSGAIVAFLCLIAILANRLRNAKKDGYEAQRIIENLSEGVYRSSLDGRQLSANPSLVKLNGYRSEAEMLAAVNAIGDEWYVNPSRREEFRVALHRDGRVMDFVSEVYRHKTRQRIWISENARLIRDKRTGKALYYEGTVRDVTEMMRRRSLEERLNKLAANIPGGLFQLKRKPGGEFSAPYLSTPFYRVLGIEPPEGDFNPADFISVIEPIDLGHYYETLRSSGVYLRPWQCEFRVNRKILPQERWLRLEATPEKTEDNSVVWNGFISDVTEQKRLGKHIEHLAYYDQLTDLPNRRLLLDRLEQARSVSQRRNKHAGVLFIDLDDFKSVNDTYGHEAGDTFICNAGNRVVEAVRDSDTVARFGGDEFVVLLHDLDEDAEIADQNARLVGEKIITELKRGFELSGTEVAVHCSIGSAIFTGKGIEPDELLRRADLAMYTAKKSGRGRVVVYTKELDEKALEDASQNAA